jgi:hypothetical protein
MVRPLRQHIGKNVSRLRTESHSNAKLADASTEPQLREIGHLVIALPCA